SAPINDRWEDSRQARGFSGAACCVPGAKPKRRWLARGMASSGDEEAESALASGAGQGRRLDAPGTSQPAFGAACDPGDDVFAAPTASAEEAASGSVRLVVLDQRLIVSPRLAPSDDCTETSQR